MSGNRPLTSHALMRAPGTLRLKGARSAMGKHRRFGSDRVNPDYKVGYCRPPHEHDFPKGKSGNPRGRPRKKPPSDMKEAVAATFNRLKHKRDGKLITGLRLFARQVVKKAIRGDYHAYLLLKAIGAIVARQQKEKRDQEQREFFNALRQDHDLKLAVEVDQRAAPH